MNPVGRRLLGALSAVPFARTLASRTPVVCLYHGVPSRPVADGIDGSVFEQHIQFLKRHFDFVHPKDQDHRRQALDGCQILLTFDDGFRNNAEIVAPILRRNDVPAIFFVSSRHTTPGKYLWFSYLWALERHFKGDGFHFRGERVDMRPGQRAVSVERLRQGLLSLTPHPAAMYEAIDNDLPPLDDFVQKGELRDSYDGMTVEQVAEIASERLFTIGGHTVDHPFLTRCLPDEAHRQMAENRIWLERLTGRPCKAIAYPGGDYDDDVLGACREAGYDRGYATIPRLGREPKLETSRMGIYSPSLEILRFKVQWGTALRAMRMRVG